MSAPKAEVFDRSLGHVRRHSELARLGRWYHSARLFLLADIKPHELPRRMENADWLRDNFVLPFPMVAIEDAATCMFLESPRYPSFGTPQILRFLDVIWMNPERAPAFADEHSRSELASLSEKDICMCFIEGVVELVEIEAERNSFSFPVITFVGVVQEHHNICTVMDKASIQMLNDPRYLDSIGLHTDRNVSAAIQEACLLCDPSVFILEEAPQSWIRHEIRHGGYRRACQHGRLRASFERPVYRVLRARHVRERMGTSLPGASGTGVRRPHERRGHWRLLRAERFVNKRGQRVWVRPSWVGPVESRRGNRRYRVVLDIAKENHDEADRPVGRPG